MINSFLTSRQEWFVLRATLILLWKELYWKSGTKRRRLWYAKCLARLRKKNIRISSYEERNNDYEVQSLLSIRSHYLFPSISVITHDSEWKVVEPIFFFGNRPFQYIFRERRHFFWHKGLDYQARYNFSRNKKKNCEIQKSVSSRLSSSEAVFNYGGSAFRSAATLFLVDYKKGHGNDLG